MRLCVFTFHLFGICHKHLQYFVILHGKFDIDELLMCTCMNTVYTPKMTAIVQYSFTSCIGRLENSLNAVNNDKITNMEWFSQKCLKLQIELNIFHWLLSETFILTVTWSSWLVSHMMLFSYIRMECEQSLCGISKDIKTISDCSMVCYNKQQWISSLC